MNHHRVNLISTGIYFPGQEVTTKSMISALNGRLSDEITNCVAKMGVNSRYSIIENYCEYLAGNCERKLISSTTEMAINASRNCLSKVDDASKMIGLVIAVTNTANRPLPCFAYEVVGALNNEIPQNINIINMQNQGCATQLKAFDLANDYLKLHPDKLVLMVVSEAHTAFADQLVKQRYYSLREVLKNFERDGEEMAATQDLIEIFLFGDGATAFLLSADQQGDFMIGPFSHLTNIDPDDCELLTMNNGGALTPAYDGFPKYFMNRNVPNRGVIYATKCVEDLLSQYPLYLSSPDKADNYFIHTGSKLILDRICNSINITPEDERVKCSYEILDKYGNLSSCSVACMLHNAFERKMNGVNMLISFGVGFSASACITES